MSSGFVSLPMYDWPETHQHHDAYFEVLQENLREANIYPMDKLRRDGENWLDAELLLSQTCGLPLVTSLERKVSLVGSPAYDIDCAPGQYYSVIVVRNDSDFEHLEDLKGARLGYSTKGSQSGFAAPIYTLLSDGFSVSDICLGKETGAHRQSIRDVASGAVDYAAIDVVSWKLALEHEGASEKLRVIGRTPPTSGLPYITSLEKSENREVLADVASKSIEMLDPRTRAALHSTGFKKTSLKDYELIKQRYLDIYKKHNF